MHATACSDSLVIMVSDYDPWMCGAVIPRLRQEHYGYFLYSFSNTGRSLLAIALFYIHIIVVRSIVTEFCDAI